MGRLDRNPALMRRYHEILAGGEVPEFLYEYAATPAMRRLRGVGCNCGMNYTSLYDSYRFFYDTLDHSLGVAAITWRFTQSRAAALAALFHDIAVPCFKHCVDFMLGDYEGQESTEARTEEIIRGSEEIARLLARDGVEVAEVLDYKVYWAADNDLPRFSADRIDYTLNFGLMTGVWSLGDLAEICAFMTELVAEDGASEIGFANLAIAEKYVAGAAKCWPHWFDGSDRLSMQLIAEVVSGAIAEGVVGFKELWTLPENEIIARMSGRPLWRGFEKARAVVESDEMPTGLFVREGVMAKRRWTDPLVRGIGRASQASELAGELIADFLRYEPKRWLNMIF